MGGYDLLNDEDASFSIDSFQLQYVQSFSFLDHLLCPICKLPFSRPYSTVCGHTFCKNCLIKSFKSVLGTKCPLDRINLKAPKELLENEKSTLHDGGDGVDSGDIDVYPAPIILTNMSDDLKVKCLNSSRGCNWIGARWSIQLHIVGDCQYTKVQCQCGIPTEKRFIKQNECVHVKVRCSKCDQSVFQLELDDHLHSQCDNNLIQCSGCQLMLPEKNIKDHEEMCDKIHLSCPGSKFGCDWKGQRDILLNIHSFECVFIKSTDYFDSLEEKINALQDENSSLKIQLSSILDSVIHGKIKNLGYCKEFDEVQDVSTLARESFNNNSTEAKVKINFNNVKMLVNNLEVNRRMTDSLAIENVSLREELASQRAMMTTLRQQMQYMLLDRHRNIAKSNSDTMLSSDSPRPSTKL